jgi:hypothetical protein
MMTAISAAIRDEAQRILAKVAVVYVDREDAAATTLLAIWDNTGRRDYKTIVHGMGYLQSTREWAASLFPKIRPVS